MTPTIFWAKPDQTYEEHIRAAYAAWKSTVSAKRNLIQRLGKLYGFSEERFLKSSLLTVVLHDIGKNIEPFQQMMQAKKEGKSFDYRGKLPARTGIILFCFSGRDGLGHPRKWTAYREIASGITCSTWGIIRGLIHLSIHFTGKV